MVETGRVEGLPWSDGSRPVVELSSLGLLWASQLVCRWKYLTCRDHTSPLAPLPGQQQWWGGGADLPQLQTDGLGHCWHWYPSCSCSHWCCLGVLWLSRFLSWS